MGDPITQAIQDASRLVTLVRDGAGGWVVSYRGPGAPIAERHSTLDAARRTLRAWRVEYAVRLLGYECRELRADYQLAMRDEATYRQVARTVYWLSGGVIGDPE